MRSLLLSFSTAAICALALSPAAGAEYAYPFNGGCGGVIEGNNRTLLYNQDGTGPIEAPSQCVWTYQPVGRFTLTAFQLLLEEGGSGLTADDQLTITVFTENYNLVASSVKPHTIVVNTSTSLTEPYEYRTPIAFAIIILRPAPTRQAGYTHFAMSIQSGPPFTAHMYEPNFPAYNWHSGTSSGEMWHPKGNADTLSYLIYELATFVLSNSTDALAGYDIFLEVDRVDVEFAHGGFLLGRTECMSDGVLIYDILPALEQVCSFNCEPWETLELFKLQDHGVCGVGGGYGYYASAGFLVILSSDQSVVGTGFQFNWKTIQRLPPSDPTPEPEPTPGAYTLCGGVIDDEAGVIEYKLNEDLVSEGEFCVWTFRASTYRRLSFTKDEGSGLVPGEDLLTITMHRIPHDGYADTFRIETVQLNEKYGGREVFNLYGTLAVVVFTSNGEGPPRRGFRLYYRAYRDHIDNARVFTDIGRYEDSGTLSHGGGHTHFFSSFVVAPNTTEPFDHVQLTTDWFDVWAGVDCSLNSLFLYEIMPTSESQAGHLQLRERLCGIITDGSYSARRGFFGLLVTTISEPYTYPIEGYRLNYTIVK